ncbi:MAG: 30S ribosome-binding factor RbfA [Eubacteriales bacterium]|nr:30S ribosome-binding factor RbfA [Eubacteriales bacterium]MDD4541216.1 30S ribosome-binding factor RbfA [Eubacteriales bacterium]
MSSRRSMQTADEVRRILSETLRNKVKDPVLDARVSFIEVRMSGDLANANVYYSVLGDEEKRAAVGKSLNKAHGFFRRELGHRMHSRLTPQIHFIEDRTIAEGFVMDSLINKVIAADESMSADNDDIDQD